jgi:predicted transglutaminase-like cysteine proteinase
LLAALLAPVAADRPVFDADALRAIEQRFGHDGAARVLAWRDLIEHERDRDLRVPDKLAAVNDFFNRLEFVDDLAHWRRRDYWATPIEFLGSAGGDCEDFAIAKYFTLLELGVPESRLQITYVKATALNQAHMVLAYYAHPGADPLVLDNLVAEILPGSSRADLVPVYSFNGQGLWLSRARGRGKRVGDVDRLSLWQDLMLRLDSPAPAPPSETLR